MTICKLCKKRKKLLKNSHIIPNFMYKRFDLFDDNHKTIKVTKTNNMNRPFNEKLISNSEYDAGLLCENCDTLLIGSRLENYGKNIIFGGQMEDCEKPIFEKIQFSGNKSVTHCQNINY